MAILDIFEAEIRVEGQQCHEYDDDDLDASIENDPSPAAAKYIEATPGQKFGVYVHVKEGYQWPPNVNTLIMEILLDGHRVSFRPAFMDNYLKDGGIKALIDHEALNPHGHWEKHHYLFSELHITQESTLEGSTAVDARYGALGTIEVRLIQYRMRDVRQNELNHSMPVAKDSVPEKALKGRAVTLGASLGDPIRCDRPIQYTGHIVDHRPLAKFIFHYRTRKSLQDLMIIPRDDAENDADDDAEDGSADEIDTMTAEELRSLLRQQKAERASKLKNEANGVVKREFEIDESNDDDILEIRTVKKPKTIVTEVIEISSD